MDILSSRILLRPRDLERSVEFYERTLGLPVYREWGEGAARSVVFFLGGGFLEVSGSGNAEPSQALQIWLQVRDLRSTHADLRARGVTIVEDPQIRPWGLFEMLARDPDGVGLVFVEVPVDHPLRRR